MRLHKAQFAREGCAPIVAFGGNTERTNRDEPCIEQWHLSRVAFVGSSGKDFKLRHSIVGRDPPRSEKTDLTCKDRRRTVPRKADQSRPAPISGATDVMLADDM